MVKRIRKYVKYTLKELEEYAKTKDSCIIKINNSMHIGLPPHGLSNINESILEIIANQTIGFYDIKFQGVILDVRNIKIIGDSGNIRADDPIIHLNIRGDCYVFQAQIGAIIRGIVKYISTSGSNYIGVIIYRVFCVPIKLQDHTKKNSIKINSEIEFRIKDFDLQSSMPFIEGELIAKEEEHPNQQFSNYLEDNEVSDDEDESFQNERQIKFSNNQRYNSESDAESEDLFDTQQNIVVNQRFNEVKKEANPEDTGDNPLKRKKIKSESNNSIEICTNMEEIEIKQETIKEENEFSPTQQRKPKKPESVLMSPSNKKQKQATPTENTLNKVKTEVKRERTISRTMSSFGSSLDNLFEKVEMEEKEYLKAKENGIDENNTEDIANLEKQFRKNADSEENETNSSENIEISNSESKETKKKRSKTNLTNSIQDLLQKVQTEKFNSDVSSIEALKEEQSAHEMLSDRESVISSSQQSNKSKKKKKKNSIENFMSDILVEIKKEKLNSFENSEQQSINNKEDITLNNDTNHETDHCDGKKTKNKKKRKNSLENSMFDILNEIKTEKLDTVEQEKQLQQISDTESINSLKTNKKKKKNKIQDSVLDILSSIQNEKLVSSSLNNNEMEKTDKLENNKQNNYEGKSKESKKKKSKRNLNDSILNLLTEIKVEKLQEEPIELSLENDKNDEIKKDNIDDNKNMKETHKSSKKKRKINVNEAVNEIINKLSSPSPQEHETNDNITVSTTKSMMNSFSSPLLSSTMINAKTRRKV